MKEIVIKGVDEIIYEDKSLYNMPVYIWQNNNLNGFYISLCVKYGSIDTHFKYKNKEYRVPNGIAHYMEHIKFNEKKDVKAHDFFNKLGSDINAFTTFEYTNYEVWAYDNYKKNLTHLLEYVLNPYFTKETVNNERGIITEEIKMDKDEPYFNLFYRNLSNVLAKSNYRNLVIGEINDINNIKLSDIKLIYDAFYHPENMFLVITGNVNPYESMEIVNNTLKKLNIAKYNKPIKIAAKEPLDVVKKEDIYYDNINIPKTKISLKIPIKSFKGLDKLKIRIYSKILLDCNFGYTSEFIEELYSNNLISYLGYTRDIMDDYLIVTITYESKTPDIVKEKILTKLKKLEINSNYLNRAIKSNIANLILNFDSSNAVNGDIQFDIINFGYITSDIKELYETVKISDIEKIIKLFHTDNYAITSLRPKE